MPTPDAAVPAPPPSHAAAGASAAAAALVVACFCARWCRLCGDYRAVFDGVLAEQGDPTRGHWIDIEDDEAVLGPVDVDDFPTLLIARGGTPVFFGPLTPQAGTLARLLRSARRDELGRLDDATVRDLLDRVEAVTAQRTAAATVPRG